jgi:hypothetical protein
LNHYLQLTLHALPVELHPLIDLGIYTNLPGLCQFNYNSVSNATILPKNLKMGSHRVVNSLNVFCEGISTSFARY